MMMEEFQSISISGEETPLMLIAMAVGVILIPWLSSNLVKWDASSRDKATWSLVIGAVGAVALEVSAGDPSVVSVASSILVVLTGQQVGYRAIHKPLATGSEEPTLLALPQLASFGLGKSSVQEQD